MYDVNWCHCCGYMVQEIATPYGLAMTEVVEGWCRFAGGAVVIKERTAERP